MSVEIVRIELGDPRIERFARLHWRLRRGDPLWTPPLDADYLGNRLLGVKGLLRPDHPYHAHAEVTHFIVRKDGRDAGRVSASVDRRFNSFHGCKVGFFGFFECVDDGEVAGALLSAAADWVAERGMEILRGPGEYGNSTHERQGLLIDGFEHPPTVEMTHSPPYHRGLVEAQGFVKAMDYHAYTVEIPSVPPTRISRLAEAVRSRGKVTTRPAELSRMRDEVGLIVRIYNEAWAENWGFVPISEDEADILAESLKPILDPGLVRFAYVDGVPAAVLGALPDPYWALRPRWRWYGDSDTVRLARLLATRRHIPRTRLMFFGIRPGFRKMGVDALLYDEVRRYALDHGYRSCELSLLLEVNQLILRAAEAMGARRYKTWRIYERPLG